MNPSVSHRRTTGADTLQIAAAWRIDVTGCSFTKRTLVGLPAPKSIPEFRTETSWPMPSLVAWPFQQNRRHVLIKYGSQRRRCGAAYRS